MPRRTEEQRIAQLESQIASLRAKAAAAKVKKDPALKHISAAIRSIDSASGETQDKAVRQALAEARSSLSACLQLNGVTLTAKGSGTKRMAGAGFVDADSLLAYVRNNSGQRGEQISAALGTDAKAMRPVMKRLIEERKIKTKGERRGMAYFAL